MPDSSAKPIAAGVPDSGVAMTRSASTGASRASGAAHLHARGVHVAAGDGGVRAGQVDVLEDAALGPRLGEALGAQAVLVDRDQLAGLDLADEARADGVQRGLLGGHHPAAVQPAEHQRPHALRVARRVERGLVHEDQGEGAAQLRQHLGGRVLQGAVGVGRPAARSSARCPRSWRACRWRRSLVRRSAASRASSPVLVRLPLWPSATAPCAVARKVGCAFSHTEEPVVE